MSTTQPDIRRASSPARRARRARGFAAATGAELGGAEGEVTRARLLGAGLAPLQARQGRDRERRLHHPPHPRRLRRRADRRSTSSGTGRTTSSPDARRRRPRCPVGPMTHVDELRRRGKTETAPRPRRRRTARPRRVPAPPLRRARLARGRAALDVRRDARSASLLGAIAGYYRGWIDTIISRLTEITMAFPVAALHRSRSRRPSGSAARTTITFGGSSARGRHARPDLHASSAGSTRRGSSARRCSRCARRSSSRRRG